jgi:hypothetical protein
MMFRIETRIDRLFDNVARNLRSMSSLFQNPVFPKSDEQRKQLTESLKDIFLFRHLDNVSKEPEWVFTGEFDPSFAN